MKITIIIPTLNEAGHLRRLLPYLKENGEDLVAEIIVSDGNSDDETIRIAQNLGVKVVEGKARCRAKQMNTAAYSSQADIFYFVHADSIPPTTFASDIMSSIRKGYKIGGYRFRFDSSKPMLRFNSWMTRFNIEAFRGGDQSLFITREMWEKLGGFDEKFVVMEEYDLLRKAKKFGRFCLIPKDVLVSARKYDENSWLRVNFANTVAMFQFRMGVDPLKIKETYSRFLRHKIISYRNI
jgi:rSAM/selenodomain-associated transferase 2